MKGKNIDSTLLEVLLFYLSKHELYEAQLAFASLMESMGLTNEMLVHFTSYLGLDEAKLRREGAQLKGELEGRGLRYFTIFDEDYPNLLKHIDQPPLLLFYRGNLACLKKKTLSVVGTRRPSFDGIKACDLVIAYMANYIEELSIVSGLALGVDSLVHRASIKYGLSAISVLPSSVDSPTPVANLGLAKQILDSGGLLLSEKFPGHSIKSYSYIERNRIISGLSTKTLIVEAALKSGSIATAKLAIEQGRDVYAMPGSLSNPVAEGCNYLISTGAYPLYKLDALLEDEEFRKFRRRSKKDIVPALPVEYGEDRILELIKKERRLAVDRLASEVDVPESVLLARLIEFELEGLITREGDDVIAL